MTTTNLEVVKSALFRERVDLVAAFVRGEYESMFDFSRVSPDVQVLFAQPSGPPTEYTGLEGLVEGWREWLEPWASYEVVTEDHFALGDRVLTLAVLRGETARDHVRFEQPAASVATITDCKVTRLEFHLSRADAFESLGVSGPDDPRLK